MRNPNDELYAFPKPVSFHLKSFPWTLFDFLLLAGLYLTIVELPLVFRNLLVVYLLVFRHAKFIKYIEVVI